MPSNSPTDDDADPDGAEAEPSEAETGLSEAEVERVARRVAREELDGRGHPVLTILAGIAVGVLVLVPLAGVVVSTLWSAGVPTWALAIAALLAASALVAYAWRLPPFE
ncbi:hypothetical protein [Halobaculum sp. D14]|uniref:hypothetical protein n=1 Tax=unclassified Halobaculum TaxID=2640896 RepID=UPI003EC06ADE